MDSRFLTEDERKTIIAMLKEDTQGLATHYDRKFVWQTLKDYKTYVQMGIYCGQCVLGSTSPLILIFISRIGLLLTVYAVSLFAPTLVKELGKYMKNPLLLW
ncbi:hypothetical protein H0H81_007654 [Sphagnurus paluster]|uniref:Uncharacterized protein n=1 Tax=Sphagnurus paluster TaxID=117069 RepID=A0A9P7K5H9_9AGAR|nr:hypothetical protein H0H81_007654 [Sphagnurus paluster]